MSVFPVLGLCKLIAGRSLLLTLSRTSGHALASGTVNGASILLQGLVGETAGAVGCLAGVERAADAGGGREGNEAKQNGGDGELHVD
jgi:hypothetical protein